MWVCLPLRSPTAVVDDDCEGRIAKSLGESLTVA